jgi:tRNA dimethylallyltransferase
LSDVSVAGSVRVICGPTASGKTTLALSLAAEMNARIISADSRQIYKGFDIGTAKPLPGELARVRHYCLDIVDPTQRYSAAAWSADATRAIRGMEEQGATPLVVGGTGFYLRSLFDPLFEEPSLDPAGRSMLAAWLERLSVAELRRWCTELDPQRAQMGRTQLLRAIEIALLTGRRVSALHLSARRSSEMLPRYLLIERDTDRNAVITRRAARMFAEGWRAEVRRLDALIGEDAPAWKATGYRIMRDLVRDKLTESQALDLVVTETRQYAKRQRTWFRHQLPAARVTRVAPEDPNLREIAARWWHGEAPG